MGCFELAGHVFVTYVRNVGTHRAGKGSWIITVVSCTDWRPEKSVVSAREGIAVGIATKIGAVAWRSAPLFILMGKKSEKLPKENIRARFKNISVTFLHPPTAPTKHLA